ncbi:hypothetical protein Bca52824_082975 [Brassica carinata]|uniref:Uncharacterized protein n=1 Tax=Brassica carinata TaxID=52824 RepID=A0A8X7TT37_BRACI|nr:hypothetical protein Bca52824_082975 [Brassica carinata]
MVNVVLGCCSLPSSSFPVTASVASISAEGGAEVAVCGDWCLGLRQALVRRFRRFGAAPLLSAASSEFSLVSLLSAGGRASW